VRTALAFCATVLALAFHPVFASAPHELLGKTVRISYTVTDLISRLGRQMSASRNVVQTLYISSAGRIFDQIKNASKVGRNEWNFAPGRTPGNFHFVGSKLVATISEGAHAARQVTISFDSAFQTCSVALMTGSDGGVRQWRALDGVPVTALAPDTYSNQTCSVASGNAFAN
jgi:hypothetical protein